MASDEVDSKRREYEALPIAAQCRALVVERQRRGRAEPDAMQVAGCDDVHVIIGEHHVALEAATEQRDEA
jgi:hypothetical protein